MEKSCFTPQAIEKQKYMWAVFNRKSIFFLNIEIVDLLVRDPLSGQLGCVAYP